MDKFLASWKPYSKLALLTRLLVVAASPLSHWRDVTTTQGRTLIGQHALVENSTCFPIIGHHGLAIGIVGTISAGLENDEGYLALGLVVPSAAILFALEEDRCFTFNFL